MRVKQRPAAIIALAAAVAVLALLVGAPMVPARSAPPFLSWTVRIKDASLALIEVEGAVSGVLDRTFTFIAPAPEGGRALQPLGIAAFDRYGRPLEVGGAGGRWDVAAGGSDFIIRYEASLIIEDRYSPEVRGMLSRIGERRSRLMGRDCFLIPQREVAPGIIVDVDLHPGAQVASAWESVGNRIVVPGADDLPATFIVTGDYRFFSESVCGVRLVLALGGNWRFEDRELLAVVTDVASAGIGLFGSSPYKKHLFVCDPNPVRGGRGFDYYGAHFSATVLLLLDPRMDRSALFDGPMALVAHEFIHAWNGDAVRPADDSVLWFTEGATVYCSHLVLRLAGIISEEQQAAIRARIGERFARNPYRGAVALAEAGNSDLGDKDMVNLLYDGGMLAAEALDLRIALETGARGGLIDVVRLLYETHPYGTRVGEREIAAAASRVAGCDLAEFIRRLVREPAPPALAVDVSS